MNVENTDLSVTLFEQDWHDTGENQALDKLGNWDLVRQQPEGGEMATITRGHNAANEYTSLNGQSAYGHDRNGNLTDDGTYTFYFDFANHLVRAVRQDGGDTVGEYHYDALGRRVRKVVDDVSDTLDGTTLFFYDGMRVIEEGRLDGSSNYQATHQYVWGLQYLDELILYDFDADGDGDFDAIDEEDGDKRYYCYHDYLYSVIGVGTAAGEVVERYDYEPYGTGTIWDGDYADTRAETHVHLDFLFTGQRYDPETGLHHFKRRALDPPLGRFLQHDPIPYNDGLNLYQYVGSSPLVDTDPFGAESCRAARRRMMEKCANYSGAARDRCAARVADWYAGCSRTDITPARYVAGIAGSLQMGGTAGVLSYTNAFVRPLVWVGAVPADNIVQQRRDEAWQQAGLVGHWSEDAADVAGGVGAVAGYTALALEALSIAGVSQIGTVPLTKIGTEAAYTASVIATGVGADPEHRGARLIHRGGAAMWRWGQDVCRRPGESARTAQLGTKLDYMFGKGSGSDHNIQRSLQMLHQLERIGLRDTPATRQLLQQHFSNVLADPQNITVIQQGGRILRESLLMGPYGAAKVESVWEGSRLITVNIFGG